LGGIDYYVMATNGPRLGNSDFKVTVKLDESFVARNAILLSIWGLAALIWLFGLAFVWGRRRSDRLRVSEQVGELGSSSARQTALLVVSVAALLGPLVLLPTIRPDFFGVTLIVSFFFLGWLLASFVLLPDWWCIYTLS